LKILEGINVSPLKSAVMGGKATFKGAGQLPGGGGKNRVVVVEKAQLSTRKITWGPVTQKLA